MKRLIPFIIIVPVLLALSPGPVSAQYCPLKVGAWDEGPVLDVVVDDGYAYLCSGSALKVADISEPRSPRLLAEVDLETGADLWSGWLDMVLTSTEATGLWTKAEHGRKLVFVAAGDAGLISVDVTRPSHPAVIGRYETEGRARTLGLYRDRLYLAVDSEGLLILDIAQPAEVAAVVVIPLPEITTFSIEGGRLYLVAGDQLLIHDLADPLAPQLLRSLTLPAPASDLVVSGGNAFLVSSASDDALPVAELQVVDLLSPEEPPQVSRLDGWGGPRRLARTSGHLLMTNWYGGLCLIDAAEPASPRSLASFQLPVPRGLAVSAGHVYVADELEGLQVFALENCALHEPSADLSWWPASPISGEPVQLEECSSGLATAWHWELGDGTTSDLANPIHTYQAPGVYQVTLKATNQHGSDTTSRTIIVLPTSGSGDSDDHQIIDDQGPW